jgi:hypothetical protein
MMVIAVMMTAVAPDAKTQAQRQRDIEMIARGTHLAEAIARYYSGGNIGPAGLVVKTPPPAYGYLTELKKLRDGVTVGNKQVYFARKSAMVDPQTNDEWEPIRVGDPRLRKFFRAWQQFTGRQLPPIYASYLGAGAVLDTTDHSAEENDGDVKPTEPGAGAPNENDDEDLDDEDLDDEDDGDDEEDDDGEDDEEEDDDGDGAALRPQGSSGAEFVNAAYQVGPPTPANSNLNTNTSPNGGRRPAPKFDSFGPDRRLGPIIGIVSKKKGTSVVNYYGVERYEEMVFILLPPPPAIVGTPSQVQSAPGQPSGPVNDANGDGIPDSVEPNKPDQPQQDDQQ